MKKKTVIARSLCQRHGEEAIPLLRSRQIASIPITIGSAMLVFFAMTLYYLLKEEIKCNCMSCELCQTLTVQVWVIDKQI